MRVPLIACTLLLCAATARAQEAPDNRRLFGFIPLDVTGSASTTGELYRHGGGTQARRPGSSWRMAFSPQATLFGEVGMGMDILLSSEGSQLRQNINQFGISPTWRWATVHAGDFSRDYSSYTMSGTRLRGGGLDLRPGKWEFSLQGGRAQRTVALDGDGAAYKRTIMAASVGYGHEGGNRIALRLMKGKDDPNSLEQDLVVVDTTFADTLLVPDRLQFATAPQENLVLGLGGEIGLFNRRLRIKSEVGASLFTRDLRSRSVSDEELGPLAGISGLQPVRLSTSGDYAYTMSADLNFSSVALRGGFEQIGPGYTSMGLPYLISDRRGYNFGGSAALLKGRVAVQGETRLQTNNVLSQLAARTDRASHTGSVVINVAKGLSTSLMLATTSAATPGTEAARPVHAHTLALSSAVSAQTQLLGRGITISFAYGFQRSEDRAPESSVPAVDGHNVTASVQLALATNISLGPSLSAVSSTSDTGESQRNMLLGVQARAKLLEGGRLVTSAVVNNTFSSGRQVMSARADAAYPLPFGMRVSLQARHMNYSAFAGRPGFNESFLTMSLQRAFALR